MSIIDLDLARVYAAQLRDAIEKNDQKLIGELVDICSAEIVKLETEAGKNVDEGDNSSIEEIFRVIECLNLAVNKATKDSSSVQPSKEKSTKKNKKKSKKKYDDTFTESRNRKKKKKSRKQSSGSDQGSITPQGPDHEVWTEALTDPFAEPLAFDSLSQIEENMEDAQSLPFPTETVQRSQEKTRPNVPTLRVEIREGLFLPDCTTCVLELQICNLENSYDENLPANKFPCLTSPKTLQSSGECVWNEEVSLPLPFLGKLALLADISTKCLLFLIWDADAMGSVGAKPLARAIAPLKALAQAPDQILESSFSLEGQKSSRIKATLRITGTIKPLVDTGKQGGKQHKKQTSSRNLQNSTDMLETKFEEQKAFEDEKWRNIILQMEDRIGILMNTIEALKQELESSKRANSQILGILKSSNEQLLEIPNLKKEIESHKSSVEEKLSEIEERDERIEAQEETINKERNKIRAAEKKIEELQNLAAETRSRFLRETEKTKRLTEDLRSSQKTMLLSSQKYQNSIESQKILEDELSSMKGLIRFSGCGGLRNVNGDLSEAILETYRSRGVHDRIPTKGNLNHQIDSSDSSDSETENMKQIGHLKSQSEPLNSFPIQHEPDSDYWNNSNERSVLMIYPDQPKLRPFDEPARIQNMFSDVLQKSKGFLWKDDIVTVYFSGRPVLSANMVSIMIVISAIKTPLNFLSLDIEPQSLCVLV
eukprot:GHVP01055893.1.p2 GENE.GHVP01055893.1~~GHVP01055893.1.p2  ORF type:complete len:711 (-),score=176.89 GHVP01055893.1:3475-5607(-)